MTDRKHDRVVYVGESDDCWSVRYSESGTVRTRVETGDNGEHAMMLAESMAAMYDARIDTDGTD